MRDKFTSVSFSFFLLLHCAPGHNLIFLISEPKDLPRDPHRKLSLIDRPKHLLLNVISQVTLTAGGNGKCPCIAPGDFIYHVFISISEAVGWCKSPACFIRINFKHCTLDTMTIQCV